MTLLSILLLLFILLFSFLILSLLIFICISFLNLSVILNLYSFLSFLGINLYVFIWFLDSLVILIAWLLSLFCNKLLLKLIFIFSVELFFLRVFDDISHFILFWHFKGLKKKLGALEELFIDKILNFLSIFIFLFNLSQIKFSSFNIFFGLNVYFSFWDLLSSLLRIL